MPEDKTAKCPYCGTEMDFIEVCNEDDIERKESHTCHDCDVICYIVSFK